MRYRMTVAYEGTAFYGWQKQRPPDRQPLRTAQGVLQAALVETLQQRVQVVGASRTDSGVHATGQVVHFDATTRIPLQRMALAINSRLPQDVEVRDVQTVPPAFDAISDADSKQYRYRIWTGRHRPLFRRRLVYPYGRCLALDRMNDAAHRLVGTHDFASFANKKHGRHSTVRTLHGCHVEPSRDGPETHIVVTGDGFLYHMVRILAGTLLDVGRGRLVPSAIDHLLAVADRHAAGPTLPPKGLCLERVRYRDDATPFTATAAEPAISARAADGPPPHGSAP